MWLLGSDLPFLLNSPGITLQNDYINMKNLSLFIEIDETQDVLAKALHWAGLYLDPWGSKSLRVRWSWDWVFDVKTSPPWNRNCQSV